MGYTEWFNQYLGAGNADYAKVTLRQQTSLSANSYGWF